MTYTGLWRGFRSRLSQIVAVVLWICLISILVILAFWRVASPTAAAGGGFQTWAHQTLDFYDKVVQSVVNEARRTNAVRIQIHTETNSTDTLCSAPCNEGLAQAICQHYADTRPPHLVQEVVFWDQPPALRAPGEALRNWCGSIPDHPAFRCAGLRAGWYLSDSDGATEKVEEPRDGKPTLHLSIQVRKVLLDHGRKIFQAQFDLYGGPTAVGQTKLLTHECQGDLAQIRWFTRARSNHTWRYRTNAAAFLLLAAILIVLMIPWVRKRLDDYVEARISIRCTTIGVVFGFVLLILTPVVRDRVDFYERANLFYIVDRTSEIWVPEDASSGDRGIPYLAERLEYDVNEKVVNPPAAMSKSFPRWLWEEGFVEGLKPIYQPERYSLNRPFVLQVFGFSGTKGTRGTGATDWIPLGMGGNGVVKQAIQGGLLAPDRTCVARQLCPQAELGLVAEVQRSKESNNQETPPSFVLLLTSQCASSPKDHQGFLASIPRVNWNRSDDIRDRCTNMHVFTAVVPSLPRSGGDRQYDYADGKHVLASLFSEQVVPLNAPTDPTWLPDIKALERSWQSRLPQPCRPVAVQRITLKSPLFDLHRLTSSHRDFWDTPRNLGRLRTTRPAPLGTAGGGTPLPAPSTAENGGGPSRDYRLLASPAAIEKTSKEVAEEFRKFVRHPDRLKTQKSVHVIGQTPWPYWLIGAGAAMFLGAWAFCLQYEDDAYRRELSCRGFREFSTPQLLHGGMPLFALLILAVFLSTTLWQSEDPQVWTSSGNPAWAFCAGVLFWACWIVVPHVYFRTFERVQCTSSAGWWTVGFAMGFMVLVLGVHVSVPDSSALWRWCKFVATVSAAGIAIWYCARKMDVFERGTGTEFLAWWRRPIWSTLLVCVLAVLLITLLRGALFAGPTSERGLIGWLTNLLSRVDFVGSVAATVLLVSGIGFGIAFTQRGRWSPKRAVIWIVPLLAAGYSIWLFLG